MVPTKCVSVALVCFVCAVSGQYISNKFQEYEGHQGYQFAPVTEFDLRASPLHVPYYTNLNAIDGFKPKIQLGDFGLSGTLEYPVKRLKQGGRFKRSHQFDGHGNQFDVHHDPHHIDVHHGHHDPHFSNGHHDTHRSGRNRFSGHGRGGFRNGRGRFGGGRGTFGGRRGRGGRLGGGFNNFW